MTGADLGFTPVGGFLETNTHPVGPARKTFAALAPGDMDGPSLVPQSQAESALLSAEIRKNFVHAGDGRISSRARQHGSEFTCICGPEEG